MLLVSKIESKYTVLFFPLFFLSTTEELFFCDLGSIRLASENEKKQYLPWPGFPEERPSSIGAKDTACTR